MGRKSTNPHKSPYQEARERLGLTREAASDRRGGMAPERLEKIENGRAIITAEDVNWMADAYQAPELRSIFCAAECPIGQRLRATPVPQKALGQIAIETLNCLHRLNRDSDRLLEIVEDGEVTVDEMTDFSRIRRNLDLIANTVSSLQLWIEQAELEGRLPGNK